MPQKLFIGNLPFRTTQDELRALFETYGPVDEASVVMDRATHRSRGFGFVTMHDRPAALEAIANLHEHAYGGRPLTVREADDRPPQ